MPGKETRTKRIVYALLLLVFCALFSVQVFADCQVLDGQAMTAKAASMTANAYFSGAILGTSIGLFLLNAGFFVLRKGRWAVTLFALGSFAVVVIGFFFVEAAADYECGGSLGGINPFSTCFS